VSPFGPSFLPQPRVFPQPFDLLTIPSLRRTPRFPRFHQLTNPSLPTIDLHPSRYQQLTDPSFRNPFVFSSIQNPGGVEVHTSNSQLSVSVPLWQIPCSQNLAASLSPLCPLFCAPSLCFQPFAASFAKNTRVGVPMPMKVKVHPVLCYSLLLPFQGASQ
jgi:hypothetical protein